MILVLDTETTGMDAATDQVIELAGVSLDTQTYAPRQAWAALVRPTIPVPPEASAVHHLTDDSFEHAFSTLPWAWQYMVNAITEGVEPDVLVAHNAAFDRGFLDAQAGGGARWICTWRCALHLFPDAPGYGNQTLRYYLGLKPDIPAGLFPHQALYDTVVTAELIREMLKIKTVDELIAMQDMPVILKKVGFGKHRGELWKDIPRSYMDWILKTGDFDIDTLHTARHYLQS